MIELDCTVKHEEWGKLGSSSFVGQLLKSQRRTVNESTPYAELWMGTHQSEPSRVANLSPDFDNKPIDSVLKAWPEFVGNLDITRKYGSNLPILVKILSIHRPLPLQVNFDPSNCNPNTESSKIVIALTPASLLCGFKSHQEIINNLERSFTLRSLINPSTFSSYKQSVNNNEDDCDPYLRQCFNEALQTCQSKQLVSKSVLFETVVDCDEDDETINFLKDLLDKSLTIYGLVAFFFLNLVHLNPDQAIIISNNQIHTYLDGNCLEVSNPNDKTIRVELNLKEYISSSSFNHISPEIPKFLSPIEVDNALHRYSHESSNLTVELINANDDENGDYNMFTSDYQAQSTPSGSFILVLGLTQTIVNNVYKIKPGQIFFVPPGLPLRFTHLRGAFRLFRVSLKP